MGRPKKEKPNHATGMYEVKVTIGHNFDGTPIRKSFYSSVSKAAAKAKAESLKEAAERAKEHYDKTEQRTVLLINEFEQFINKGNKQLITKKLM